MQTRQNHQNPTDPPRRAHRTPAMLVALACAGALSGCGGGADTRSDKPGVNVGLESVVGDGTTGVAEADIPTDLEALIAEQAAQLAEAYGTPAAGAEEPETDWTADAGEATADTSLTTLLGEGDGGPDDAPGAVASDEEAPVATTVSSG
ncbi:MAG: hypothetical protein ACF8LK_10085, partial [Phycisphaerales bacterium JB041]